MTRYFFHVYDDQATIDEEGIELSDIDAARERGLREVRALAAESVVEHGHLVLHHRIDIMSAEGVVATVQFGDAVLIKD